MALRTYDPALIAVSLGGAVVTGIADGEFLRCQRDQDAYTKVTGASGETSRTKSNNRGGQATIILKQTSDFNAVLSAFAESDELGNAGVFPFIIKDVNGTTLVFAKEAWVRKMPNLSYAKDEATREWVIDLAEMAQFTGGNLG